MQDTRSEHSNPATTITTIAMLTYRRDTELERVLPHLVDQASTVNPPADIVIIDNDPQGGARSLVEKWRASGVRYAHEPRPGIAAARNRAFDEARASRSIVFIDDDEIPGAGWLEALVTSWQRWGCAGVSGPVVSVFESEPVDPWVLASDVFTRRRRTTGAVVAGAATNNLLLDLDVVRRLDLRFDEGVGLIGGEDTLFTHQLIRLGGEIRWCDEAEVVEPVPAARSTRRWVLRRTFRAGTSWSRMELELAHGPMARSRVRLSLVARAAVRLPAAALRYGWGRVSGDVGHRARGACVMASYLGLLVGAAGRSLDEYRRT